MEQACLCVVSEICELGCEIVTVNVYIDSVCGSYGKGIYATRHYHSSPSRNEPEIYVVTESLLDTMALSL